MPHWSPHAPDRVVYESTESGVGQVHPHEVYVFGTGHGSFDTNEDVRQVRTILEFLAAHVPGMQVPAS